VYGVDDANCRHPPVIWTDLKQQFGHSQFTGPVSRYFGQIIFKILHPRVIKDMNAGWWKHTLIREVCALHKCEPNKRGQPQETHHRGTTHVASRPTQCGWRTVFTKRKRLHIRQRNGPAPHHDYVCIGFLVQRLTYSAMALESADGSPIHFENGLATLAGSSLSESLVGHTFGTANCVELSSVDCNNQSISFMVVSSRR